MEKNINKISFDYIKYLNTYCLNKDEYELNTLLANLNTKINKLNLERKLLIKSNFTKYLLCKNTIEKIQKEGNLKKINIKEIIKESKKIKENFYKIILDAKINLEEEKKKREREYLINKYKYIFKGPERLKKYFIEKDYQSFSEYFIKSKIQYKELKESKYIQKLWKEILFYRNSICEELALKIESGKSNKESILYYFLIYFKLKGKKHKNKIGNTLLTNLKVFLKISCENIFLIEIDDILFYTFKVINIIKEFFFRDLMIKELFKSLNNLIKKFNNENIIIYNIFLSKIKEFYNKIRIENILSISFIKQFEILESFICKIYLKNKNKKLKFKIKKALTVFNNKIVKIEVENILIKFIKYRPPVIYYLENINKLQFKIQSINSIFKIFNESLDYSFLNDFNNKILTQEILAFSHLNIKDGNNEEILMLAVKLKNKIPFSFPKLVLIKKEIFLKNDLRKFFLQKYIKDYKSIEIQQTKEFKDIYKSFGFLIT